jgi:hypothetical protein
LAALVARLDPTPNDKRRAREVLLGLLTAQSTRLVTKTKVTAELVAAFLQLDPTPDDKCQVCHALLGLLRKATVDGKLRDSAAFGRLFRQNSGIPAVDLAAVFLQLDPTPSDKHQAWHDLLGLLTGPPERTQVGELAAMVAQLDPTPGDKRQSRDVVLAQLADDTHGLYVKGLASALVQLDPTPGDRRQARLALLDLLRGEAADAAAEVMAGLNRLDATPDDMSQARGVALEALLEQLSAGRRGTVGRGGQLYGTVAKPVMLQLASAPADKRQALDALLGLLARETDSHVPKELIDGIAQLDPEVHDLSPWRTWAAPPSAELLAAARRNSSLDEWLTMLPSLNPHSS